MKTVRSQNKTRAYARNWWKARRVKMNALGLTARGKILTQRPRVMGRPKVELQRIARAELKALGLTVRGTEPKRYKNPNRIETAYKLFREQIFSASQETDTQYGGALRRTVASTAARATFQRGGAEAQS